MDVLLCIDAVLFLVSLVLGICFSLVLVGFVFRCACSCLFFCCVMFLCVSFVSWSFCFGIVCLLARSDVFLDPSQTNSNVDLKSVLLVCFVCFDAFLVLCL